MRRVFGYGIAAAALGLLASVAQVSAQQGVRVRGTIEQVVGDVYVVRTRDSTVVKLKLGPNAGVAASVKSAMTDITPGTYVGVAAVPQADGSLSALEVHVFHESMRGTAEGHRAWDLLPKSTMTNAVVDQIVGAVSGHSVALKYKDGQKQLLIPAGTVIVSYLPGSVAELKPGAAVFVPTAISRPDGTLEAQRVMVGRDVPPPQ
jgi:hypothetical protein